MKVRAVFAHPVSGIHDVIVGNTETKTVEEFKKRLEEHGCSVLFVEEIKD